MTRFNIKSTSAEAVSALSDDIKGKNVLITGASPQSIGARTAQAISQYTNLVVVTGRSQSKLDETVQNIKAEVPSANVRTLLLDLCDPESVRKAADEVDAYPEKIDVLINSAGVMCVPFELTKSGWELHMHANHFGHFLFTALIWPSLLAAGASHPSVPARVVSVTSGGHRITPMIFDDLEFGTDRKGERYDKWKGYGMSKTANVLFANEIARRAKEKNVPVVAYSIHPGVSINTGLGKYITMDELKAKGLVNDKGEFTPPLTPDESLALTQIVSAFDPSIVSESGSYLALGDIHNEMRAPHATGEEDGKRLWSISEERCNVKFDV